MGHQLVNLAPGDRRHSGLRSRTLVIFVAATNQTSRCGHCLIAGAVRGVQRTRPFDRPLLRALRRCERRDSHFCSAAIWNSGRQLCNPALSIQRLRPPRHCRRSRVMSILRSWTRRLNIVHEINVTGFTDVVLVLLIIFMIVAKRRAASRMRATSSVPEQRCRRGLRRVWTSSALPSLPQSVSRGPCFRGFLGAPPIRTSSACVLRGASMYAEAVRHQVRFHKAWRWIVPIAECPNRD
jgi:hypothetical protein